MKKAITLVCFGMMCVSSYSQLKVNEDGLVGIGGSTKTGATLNLSSNTSVGIAVGYNNTSLSSMMGIYVSSGNSVDTRYTGVFVGPSGGISTQNRYGVVGIVQPTSKKCYGIYGELFNYEGHYYAQGAGIYGASSLDNGEIAYPGAYAGYFNGDVRVTGILYGTLSTPTENSNSISAKAVGLNTSASQNLRFADRLQGVSLLQFDKADADKVLSNRKSLIFPKLESGEAVTKEMIDEYVASCTPQKTTVSYGLAADQLKEVFPDLVHEDEDGNVSISYVELIPLLVQALNELNAELAELKSGNVYSAKSRTVSTNVDALDIAQDVLLAQNVPNPFSDRTTVDITVPEAIRTAYLFIYDMNGKQVKRINITERGNCKINITSEGLEAGMYLYSLMTDGKIVSTKRMVLTK